MMLRCAKGYLQINDGVAYLSGLRCERFELLSISQCERKLSLGQISTLSKICHKLVIADVTRWLEQSIFGPDSLRKSTGPC